MMKIKLKTVEKAFKIAEKMYKEGWSVEFEDYAYLHLTEVVYNAEFGFTTIKFAYGFGESKGEKKELVVPDFAHRYSAKELAAYFIGMIDGQESLAE